MPCAQCNILCHEIEINSPRQLAQAISDTHSALKQDFLRENIFESARAVVGQKNFSEVAESGSWPDVMHYYFYCIQCHEAFELHAETYHGSGGKWRNLGQVASPR